MTTLPKESGVAAGRSFRVYGAADLGTAVRQFRLQAGLSQARLAQMCGIHRSYLSDLEGGKVTEQLGRLVEILGVLGVEINLQHRPGS